MRFIKYLLIILLLALAGYFIYNYEENYKNYIELENERIIKNSHENAIKSIESAVSSYYFIVASIKAYTRTLDSPPTEEELQEYIADYTDKVNFKDSILLSFLDTNHKFIYTVGPNQIDPVGLKGFNVSWFRSNEEIAYLDSVMNVETISLNPPINLAEGWPAFPFSFNVKYKNKIIYGYIAAVLDIKYLTKNIYQKNFDKRTFHRLIVNDSIDFTDIAVYDKTTIFNEEYDSLYYKNKDFKSSDFIYTSNTIFGQKFTIGTTLVKTKKGFEFINYIFEIYTILALLILFLIWMLGRKEY